MEALKKLVAGLGSQQKAAELLGVTQGMINNVLKGKKRFSAQRAIAIEERTKNTSYKIKRADLRPDLFNKNGTIRQDIFSAAA